MENTPVLHTERLLLRPFAPEDAGAMYHLLRNEAVHPFLPWFPPASVAEAGEFLRQRYLDTYQRPAGFRYAVCLLPDPAPIGYVNLAEGESHDLGYALDPAYWGRGLITEACEALIRRAQQAGIPYITATHDVRNPRSGAVMRRLGMTYCYTYEELWEPKHIEVAFRMYQRNLDGRADRVYQAYWDRYPVHYIEEQL